MTTIVCGGAEEIDAGAIYRHVLPTVQELDGFKGMLVLLGEDERTLLAVTLWKSAASLDAAEPVLETLKQAETAYRRVEANRTVRYTVAGSQFAV